MQDWRSYQKDKKRIGKKLVIMVERTVVNKKPGFASTYNCINNSINLTSFIYIYVRNIWLLVLANSSNSFWSWGIHSGMYYINPKTYICVIPRHWCTVILCTIKKENKWYLLNNDVILILRRTLILQLLKCEKSH